MSFPSRYLCPVLFIPILPLLRTVFDLPSRQRSSVSIDHHRGLTSLSTSIRTITAKMSLLKQDLSSHLSSLPEPSKQSVFETYDSLGQDLHSLLRDWQLGRTDLIHLLSAEESAEGTEDGVRNPLQEGIAGISPLDGILRETVVDDIQSIADSGLGISVSSSRGFNSRSKRDSCGDWGVAFPSPRVETPDLENIFEETEMERVLIGTAMGRNRNSGGRGESRDVRIERMRREREEEIERKRVREESGRWVGELKDVLGRRRRE